MIIRCIETLLQRYAGVFVNRPGLRPPLLSKVGNPCGMLPPCGMQHSYTLQRASANHNFRGKQPFWITHNPCGIQHNYTLQRISVTHNPCGKQSFVVNHNLCSMLAFGRSLFVFFKSSICFLHTDRLSLPLDKYLIMKNKRYIVYFLFLVSMIMLAVPAIPHHHHANGIICMKNDVTPDVQCPAHHHHSGDDPCCSDGCLTRFDSPTPSAQADNGPQYVFIAILFTDFIIENLFKPQEQRIKNYYAYRESLYGTDISRTSGLRAPPSV